MTTPFRGSARCPNCGFHIPLEDEISHWIRSHPELDSGRGLVVMDKDLAFQRYKTSFGRDFQCFMFVEVKTHGKKLGDSQRDTMHLLDQLLRTDRNTPTKRRRMHCNNIPRRVYSVASKKWIEPKAFGVHLLTLSGSTPDDSLEIRWDKKVITREMLIGILKFDINPDTLQKMDWRIHHQKIVQPEMSLLWAR
jgi:hypothetical protein